MQQGEWMPDYAALGGLANGIREGILGYQTAQQIKRQQDMENLMKGIQKNPETGNLEYTPEMKQKKALQDRITQSQLAEYEPGSAKRTLGGLLGEDIDVPESMTIAEAKGLMPAITGKLKQKQENEFYNRYLQTKTKALEDKIKAPPSNAQDFKNLPKEKQIQINVLANQKAKTQSVENMMSSLLEQLDNPKISDQQKATSALEQLKLMNSQLGPDALGSGEAERVSAWLSNKPNLFIGKYKLGPDIKKFREQLANAVGRNKKGMGLIDQQINELYGRPPVKGMVNESAQESTPQESYVKEWNGVKYKRVGDQWIPQ